jgi:hypothetical protein
MGARSAARHGRGFADESRLHHGKLTDPGALSALLDEYDLFQPVGIRRSFTLDLGKLSADDAAEHIADLARKGGSDAGGC